MLILFNQQGLKRHRHGCLLQVGRLQQRLGPGGGNIGKKWCEQWCANRQALNGYRKTGLQRVGRGQAGLSRALCRCAGEIAAGAFKSGELALINLRLQQRGNLLGGAQHRLPAGTRYHHQIAHIWRAHVGAQTGVERHVSLRHRTQGRNLVILQTGAVLDQHRARRQHHRGGHPAQCGGALHPAGQHGADSRYIMNTKLCRQQIRQHETGHCGSGCQPGNGISPKLRKPRKTRQKQRSKAKDRGQHAQADSRPEVLDPIFGV